MRALLIAALGLLAAARPAPAGAQEAKPLFADDTPIHLTVRGPIAAIMRRAPHSMEASDAAVSVAGSPEVLPVKLSPRGHMRRQSGACTFAPLRIAFADKPPPASLFRGQKKLKLVTHCEPDASAQQRLLVEYAVYRMYNLLTPLSFRARLAQVDYQEDGGRPVISRLGVLLEEPADAAARNRLEVAKVGDRLPASRLQPQGAARTAMFEDLVGNLDWSMTAAPKDDDCCHNTKLVGPEGAVSGLIPLPYDWDSSGLVDAPYAAPPAGLGVESVRTRRYRGYCRHNAEAREVAAELVRRRGELLGVLDALPQLSGSARSHAKSYLADFLQQVSTEAGVTRVLATCIG